MFLEGKVQKVGYTNLPKDFVMYFSRSPQFESVDMVDIINNSLRLGLLAEKYAQPGSPSKFYIGDSQHLKRLDPFRRKGSKRDEDGKPYFPFENFSKQMDVMWQSYVLPKLDLKEMVEDLGQGLIKVNDNSDPITKAAVDMTVEVAQNIEGRYGAALSSLQRTQLQRIDEGVGVVDGLIDHVPNIVQMLDFGTLMSKFVGLFPPRLYADLHGLAMPPYTAILIDRAFMESQSRKPKGEKCIAHEIFHVISSQGLPQLLDEAATDFFAEEVTGHNADSQNRMTEGFQKTYQIWERSVDIAGQNLALQGYLEDTFSVETSYTRSKRVTNLHIYHPFHDYLREQFGEEKSGKNRWDQALAHIANKEFDKAYKIVIPERSRHGLRKWFFS